MGPDNQPVQVWEIVDGQQRIEALAAYYHDEWQTLTKDDPKLSLPDAIRQAESPWEGKLYSQLTPLEKDKFKNSEILAMVITSVINDDEVRDLFIRLQAGTALTRQQIRDAWPGNIGPFVESLAGRLKRRPTSNLFSWIDKRGTRGSEDYEDNADEYVSARQTCAQLLTLYFERERSPDSMPSLASRTLDDMYHKNTTFDTSGDSAMKFKQLLKWCNDVVVTHEDAQNKVSRKNLLFSLFTFLDDLSHNSTVHINDELIREIGREFWSRQTEEEPRFGKVIASTTLQQHYDWFVNKRLGRLIIPGLDSQRLFNEQQKDEIWERSKRSDGTVKCEVCGLSVNRDQVEFDHVLPWIRGGRTVSENGRIVHKECHARGRPAAQTVRTE